MNEGLIPSPSQPRHKPTMIKKINHPEAKRFIEENHYSHRCPTGKNTFFGWFVEDTLYAVADYGIGVNPYQAQSLSKLSGVEVTTNQLVELKRLCRIEPKREGFPLTKFLSQCHKILRQEGVAFVVSFSDPAEGHCGGIYKAANFKYLGKTNAETHAVEPDGTVRHRRLYFRHARRNNITVAEARKELGLTLIKTVPKDRWLLRIGNVREHKKGELACLFA